MPFHGASPIKSALRRVEKFSISFSRDVTGSDAGNSERPCTAPATFAMLNCFAFVARTFKC